MPSSAAAARLAAYEAEIATIVTALVTHLKRVMRAAKANDCASALNHHDRAVVVLGKAVTTLEQAAALEAKLRGESPAPRPPSARSRAPQPAAAPAPRGRPGPRRRAPSKPPKAPVKPPRPRAAAPRALPPRRTPALPAPNRPRLPPPPATPAPRPVAPGARGSAPRCPPDRLECGYTIAGGTCSIAAGLRLPARGGGIGTTATPARYCVVEIEQLHTSHLPLKGFAPDPDFPEGAQERDYQLKAERAKVEAIAQDYDPALIFNTSPGASDGAPVVTKTGIVLGGNGRTMATRLVYAGRGGVDAEVPRAFLLDHAHEFGLSTEDLEGFKHPMLVRTVDAGTSARELAEWSRRLNVSLGQELDATRLAVSRANFVTAETLGELVAMDEDETLTAFLSSARSRPFVRALQRDGVIDGRAAQTYLNAEGLLTDRGRDLVTDLLVASLVPDANLIASWGRGPVAALARAAPALVPLIDTDYDLREPLKKAIRDLISMKIGRYPDLERYLRQTGLLAGGAASEGDQHALIVLRIPYALDDSPVRLTRWARSYRDLASPGASGQVALFAAEQLGPLDALRTSARDAGVDLP